MVARRGATRHELGVLEMNVGAGHAVFKSRDVLHNPDNSADVASAWDY
jgi:hypothetical protein